MRAPLFLLVLVALPAFAPLAEAAGSRIWSADSQVDLVDATRAVETRRVTYDGTYYSSRWTLNVPTDATFREARDGAGALPASVSGSKVTVNTRGSGVGAYAFTVVFDLATRQEGPYVGFAVRVDGDVDSPTTVRATVPQGWSLPGWFSGTGGEPDVGGVFRKVGGQHVDFLAYQGMDPGPDARGEGAAVLREAVARVGEAGTRLSVTHVYDTDVYSPTWRLPLPEGARVLGASSPVGAVPATVTEPGTVTVQAPYKAGYHLGGRPFTLDLMLPAPEAFGGPYRQANLSLAATDGDAVSLRVELAEGLALVGSRVSGGAQAAPLRYEGTGPMRVQVAFLPPVPAGEVRFASGAYVVQAPATLESAARATAEAASRFLPTALEYLGGRSLARPFHVAYTDADVFGWEEGFYTHGMDAISIRASDLRGHPDDGKARLVPVATLLHETAHGLVDRAFRDNPDGLSFLHEGLARLAETHAEKSLQDQVVSCTTNAAGTRCERHSAKPEPDRLQAYFKGGAPFDLTWSTDSAAADARGFLYDYSGLVFHAYERAAGPDALRYAVAELANETFMGSGSENAEKVVRTLLAWAPGMTRDQLLYPGRQVAHLGVGQFRACMGDLLPPPYPFETTEPAPAAGCGWPTVGTREPPPPAPASPAPSTPTATPTAVSPTPAATPTSFPATTPVATTPRVSTTAPAPTPTPTRSNDPVDRVSATPRSGVTPTEPQVAIPAPGLPLLLALLAACAVLLGGPRRRT